MGLLDSLASQVLGSLSGQASQGNPATTDLIGLVMQVLNHPQVGGLSGLVKAFEDKGLGQVIASWVGTGANLPISANQIAAVLGEGPLRDLARQAGAIIKRFRAIANSARDDLRNELGPEYADLELTDEEIAAIDAAAKGGMIDSRPGR